MSRISSQDIWEFYFNDEVVARCCCCKYKIIFKNAKKTSIGFWVRGHIIHAKDGGPDIYENIRPICEQCNIDDKSYDTSLHYMVKIGTINHEEIEEF